MRDLYKNMIVDIGDPQCEFIKEFNQEVHKYGAIVYNEEYNSYQFIRNFNDIDIKKEVLPDFIKVKDAPSLLNSMLIEVHYEFDPESDEDEENQDIWQNEISLIDLPIYEYDDDGEVFLKDSKKMNVDISKHYIWFLKNESYDYIMDIDLLLISPIIKDINIAKKLITNYGVHPFLFQYDKNDIDNISDDLPVYHHHHHDDEHE